ncbi:tyrosine-protein kinase family protein [Actinomyces vulturis]|uniref:tyrosine-protein kinase family protein n=1 Tax=Actinomyces vulturis TaxID=1857645 RepID=UPI00082FE0D4|nr:hypothetical protein [Actinomyces vulturis]
MNNTLGIACAPALQSRLQDGGVNVVGGSDPRQCASAIKQLLSTDNDVPVLLVLSDPSHEKLLHAWSSAIASRCRLFGLGESWPAQVEPIATPIALDDLCSTLGLKGTFPGVYVDDRGNVQSDTSLGFSAGPEEVMLPNGDAVQQEVDILASLGFNMPPVAPSANTSFNMPPVAPSAPMASTGFNMPPVAPSANTSFNMPPVAPSANTGFNMPPVAPSAPMANTGFNMPPVAPSAPMASTGYNQPQATQTVVSSHEQKAYANTPKWMGGSKNSGVAGADHSNVIFVISPRGGTGKTLTAISLAQTMSNLGKRSLLVDAHVGQPGLTHHLDAIDCPTVNDIHSGATVNDIVVSPQDLSAKVGFASVLAPPREAVIHDKIFSDYMRVLDTFTPVSDLVVVDTPPIWDKERSGIVNELIAPSLNKGAWALVVLDGSIESTAMFNQISAWLQRLAPRHVLGLLNKMPTIAMPNQAQADALFAPANCVSVLPYDETVVTEFAGKTLSHNLLELAANQILDATGLNV